MEVELIEVPLKISAGSLVRLKEAGNITEIMFSEKRSQGGYIQKIDKEQYCDKRTGEVFNFKHIENRAEDKANVAKSLSQGRDLLNANITDVSKCRWLTLTYAENMTDPHKLYRDFMNFNKRCRAIYGDYEYITASEPQGRGAWHLHCVLLFKDKAPYMENSIVSDCWKQGFVTVKRLDNVDNVGAYLTAYLGDMELSEYKETGESFEHASIKEVECKNDAGEKQKKKYVKGARLSMYPPGFHIFRWSKGIKKPVVSLTSYKQAKEKVRSAKQTFIKTVSLKDVDKNFRNTLQYEYYNSIRELESQDVERKINE